MRSKMKQTRGRGAPERREKEAEDLVSRGLAGSGCEEGGESFSRDTHPNFTPAAGGLSVTHDAAGGDIGRQATNEIHLRNLRRLRQ